MAGTKIPKAFISYSHDSPEHKRWVTEFSSRLIENGINVILDQWDLGLGDDVPKFMERSVNDSDRVLMICTENYVHKANDGTGGVGYEAMIVTGELVRDLGTSKFVPVVRQKSDEKILPKSISTRFYVDLSADDEEQFQLLLRELHQAPAVEKPALGNNPFAKSPSGEELPTEEPTKLQLDDVSDPAESYSTAIEVARAGDILQWRELTRNARRSIGPRLAEWRARHESAPDSEEALIDQSLEGISNFSPLTAIALAGVGSGREKFANQLALLEELLNPKDWNRGGLTVVVELPAAAAFIYQAFHGAMCLYTEQVSHAIEMIRSYMDFPHLNESIPIWKNHEVMGWPGSLGGNSNHAWRVLLSLPEKWPWINAIFGDAEEFHTALVAYYITLNINEYAYMLEQEQEHDLVEGRLRLDIPLSFLITPKDVQRRAYMLVLQNPEQIRSIWQSLRITDDRFSAYWQKWIELCLTWKFGSGFIGFRPHIVHSSLPKDLHIA